MILDWIGCLIFLVGLFGSVSLFPSLLFLSSDLLNRLLDLTLTPFKFSVCVDADYLIALGIWSPVNGLVELCLGLRIEPLRLSVVLSALYSPVSLSKSPQSSLLLRAQLGSFL